MSNGCSQLNTTVERYGFVQPDFISSHDILHNIVFYVEGNYSTMMQDDYQRWNQRIKSSNNYLFFSVASLFASSKTFNCSNTALFNGRIFGLHSTSERFPRSAMVIPTFGSTSFSSARRSLLIFMINRRPLFTITWLSKDYKPTYGNLRKHSIS